MRTTILILLTVAAVIGSVSFATSAFERNFTALNESRQPDWDTLNYWDITTDDMREMDPEGFADLAEMEFTPERTALSEAWATNLRRIIFERRYGYPYPGPKE